MTNRNEQGVSHPEGLTRREALQKIPGLTAIALVLAGGCVEVDLPQTTGWEGNDRPQIVSEPQIDEEAARDVSVVSVAAIVTMLFFLRGIK